MTAYRTGLPLLVILLLAGGCLFDSDGDKEGGSYEINGYVLTEIGGPIKGVEMKAYFDTGSGMPSAPSTSTVTNSQGYYHVRFDPSIEGLLVRPSKADCVFSPPKVSYYQPSRSLPSENFTGSCGSIHRIEGHVRTPGGDPVKGVAVMIRDDENLWNTTVFTDRDGLYIIRSVVAGHDYFVKPSFAGYTFDPAQRNYQNMGKDFTGQDFTANPLGAWQTLSAGESP